MRGFRYSIASMLVVVGLCGVGFAALRNASEVWVAALFTLTVATLLGAVLGTIYRRGRTRAFWLGFALFGGCFLILSLVPAAATQLPSTALLDQLERMRGNAQAVAFNSDGSRVALRWADGSVRVWHAQAGKLLSSLASERDDLLKVVHSLTALSLALAGGVLGRFLYAARERHGNDHFSGGVSPCDHLDSQSQA